MAERDTITINEIYQSIQGESTWAGWPSFIPLSLALLLALTYFMIASLWAAHKLYSHDTHTPHHVLFDMAQIQSSDTFVFIDLGLRQRAIELGHRLTSGQILVVDVYSPQLTMSDIPVMVRPSRN